MTPTDLLIPSIAFILGIVAAYLFFRQQISAIEGRARNDLERWKLECTSDIRKDSVNRSRSTLKGRISEQMAPLLPEFPFAYADARFIGNPIDLRFFLRRDVLREKQVKKNCYFPNVKRTISI
jgi:predicted Holliday junction resolvase-like endonuclease